MKHNREEIDEIVSKYKSQDIRNSGYVPSGKPVFNQLKHKRVLVEQESQPFGDFMSGAVGCAIGKTVVAPIQRMRTLYVVDRPVDIKAYVTQLERYMKAEGIGGFWRGNFLSIMRFFPKESLMLATRDYLRTRTAPKDQCNYMLKLSLCTVYSGGAAGALVSALTHPYAYTRARFVADQAGQGPHKFASYKDCFVKLVKSEGFFSFFRGSFPVVMESAVFRGVQFGMFDAGKVYFFQGNRPEFAPLLLLGFAASTAGSFVTFPIPGVLKKINMSGQSHLASTMTGIARYTLECIGRDGVASLWKGGAFVLMRGLTGGAVLVAYERIKTMSRLI